MGSNVCLTDDGPLSRPLKEDRRAIPLSSSSLLQAVDGVMSLALFRSVQFSSKWYLYALGKAYMRSIPYFRDFPNVAFETVRIFVWLTMGSNVCLTDFCLIDDGPFSSFQDWA